MLMTNILFLSIRRFLPLPCRRERWFRQLGAQVVLHLKVSGRFYGNTNGYFRAFGGTWMENMGMAARKCLPLTCPFNRVIFSRTALYATTNGKTALFLNDQSIFIGLYRF